MTDGAAAVCFAAAVDRGIIADAIGHFQPIPMVYSTKKVKRGKEMTSNPYRVSEEALNELHSRLRAGLEECPPFSVVQRCNREVSALWDSPCTYALLIADDAIKALRRKGIHAQLSGKWENSLCAYQMGLIPENPMARNASSKSLIKDGLILEPVQIAVDAQHRECFAELLKQCVQAWGFWMHPQGQDTWRLISYGFREDDIYAQYAPKLVMVC